MLSPLRLREDNIIESPLDFIELIKKAWGNYNKPLCKLFKTNTSGYLYDTGTNKLLKCSKKEYQFIDILFSCSFADAIDRLNQIYPKQEMLNIMNEIGKKMEQEKILLVTNASFGQGAHFHNYEAQMRDHLSNILLEVTERCNLRCIYCIYNNKYQGKRDHGLRDMSTNIAYRAIDFLAEHSKNCDEVAITFYGGEPLLNFSLIKSCVGYAQKRIKKNIFHSITTNGIFLDHEKADFFYKNGFSVVVSLDGNKITHDE